MKTLFKNCGIITTTENGFETIRNGFLGVDKDTICYIGIDNPTDKYDIEKDMSGKVLCPGLINTHCHAAMTLLRGIGSDLPLHEWLFDNMFPIEDRLRAEDVLAGSELAVLEMIATGTTSFSDMYYFSDTTADAVLASGMKANISRAISSFDPNEAYEDSYRVKEALDFYDKYNNAGNGRVKVDLALHAEYTLQEHIARTHSEKCAELGAVMHIHLSETKSEHEECIRKYGKTPAKWFYDLGTFNSPTIAAHCVWVSDEDMDILSSCGVTAVHNPTSNLKLGSGFAPIHKMMNKGINIGLGTDGAASNNNLNLMEDMHIASIMHNGITGDPTIIKPNEVLTMTSTNGAKAQNRPDCGRLSVGCKADIIAVDFNMPHLLPAFDPVSLMCYSAQGSDVCMTMVDGRILYENGEFLTMDAERVYADVRRSLKHLYQ